MGLLDKLKNKTPKKEHENEINEAQKTINKIDIGLGENANQTIRKKLNQKLDEAIINEYGTSGEKQKLSEKKEQEKIDKEHYEHLKTRYDKAKRMHDRNSIKIYNELITETKEKFPDLTISSYHGLMDTYAHIRQYDNAINAANECIEYKREHDQDCSYELHRIEVINRYKNG